MRRLLFDPGTRETLTSIALLFLRVCTGAMMIHGHGYGKWKGFPTLLGGKWQSPEFWPLSALDPKISLALAILGEFIAPLLIICGLMTRLNAFLLSFTMIVAAFLVHGADPFQKKELALLYLVAGITLILSSGGKFSVDSLLSREKRRRW